MLQSHEASGGHSEEGRGGRGRFLENVMSDCWPFRMGRIGFAERREEGKA